MENSMTTYTFHRAADHQIIATANPSNLREVAQNVARNLATDGDRRTHRVYIHNGRGVVSAILCRGGEAHDTLRDNYMGFEPKARSVREAAGHAND